MNTERKRLLNLTRAIYAAWILTDDNEVNITPMPSSHSLWANTLSRMAEEGQIPESVLRELFFFDGHQGIECPQVPAIQTMAAEMVLSRPDLFADTDRIEVSKVVGRQMAIRCGVGESELIAFGKLLRAEMLAKEPLSTLQ